MLGKTTFKSSYGCIEPIYKQIENDNVETQYNSVVKTLWSVQSNQRVIDTISKLNSRNKVISIFYFDFFTLYTNILDCKLKSVTGELINICCNGGDKQFFWVTRYGTIWTNNQQKSRFYFNKPSLKLSSH